jgi:hypothetical protein
MGSNVRDILRAIQSGQPHVCHFMSAACDPPWRWREGVSPRHPRSPLTLRPWLPPRRISRSGKHGAGTFPDADGGRLPVSGSSRHPVSPAGKQRPWLPRSQTNAPLLFRAVSQVKPTASPQCASQSPGMSQKTSIFGEVRPNMLEAPVALPLCPQNSTSFAG